MVSYRGKQLMDKIISFCRSHSWLKFRPDDDGIDRIHHQWTCSILMTFAIVVSSHQYFGSPVVCWLPDFLRLHTDYINSYCWLKNSYWLPLNEDIPSDVDTRGQLEVSYYQFVPFFLAAQAVCFLLPYAVWRSFVHRSGLNPKTIVTAARQANDVDNDDHGDRLIRNLSRYIDASLRLQRKYRTGCLRNCRMCCARFCCIMCGNRYGNFMFTLYLMCKLMYLVNVVGQIVIMNVFLLGGKSIGMEFFQMLFDNHLWQLTGKFPRVCMCDFSIRVLGNVHRHTVQCILPINLFHEKIYLFMWYWFSFVTIATVISFLHWTWRIGLTCNRRKLIKHNLCLLSAYEKDCSNSRRLTAFVNKYLKPDGVFMIQLVSSNAGELFACQLTAQLWNMYKKDGSGGLDKEISQMMMFPDNNIPPSAPPLMKNNSS